MRQDQAAYKICNKLHRQIIARLLWHQVELEDRHEKRQVYLLYMLDLLSIKQMARLER